MLCACWVYLVMQSSRVTFVAVGQVWEQEQLQKGHGVHDLISHDFLAGPSSVLVVWVPRLCGPAQLEHTQGRDCVEL